MHTMVKAVSVNLWFWLTRLLSVDKSFLDLDYSGYHKRKICSWINREGFFPPRSFRDFLRCILGLLLRGSGQVYKKASQS